MREVLELGELTVGTRPGEPWREGHLVALFCAYLLSAFHSEVQHSLPPGFLVISPPPLTSSCAWLLSHPHLPPCGGFLDASPKSCAVSLRTVVASRPSSVLQGHSAHCKYRQVTVFTSKMKDMSGCIANPGGHLLYPLNFLTPTHLSIHPSIHPSSSRHQQPCEMPHLPASLRV